MSINCLRIMIYLQENNSTNALPQLTKLRVTLLTPQLGIIPDYRLGFYPITVSHVEIYNHSTAGFTNIREKSYGWYFF